MDINNRRHLRAVAKDRIGRAQSAPKICLIYGGIVAAVTLLTTGVNVLTGMQMENLGGLQHNSTRALLSTISTVLPLLVNFLLMAMELGFLNTMLRISRNQYASPQGLKLGFQRFWLLLKTVLLQSGLFSLAILVSMHIGPLLFSFTPPCWKMVRLINAELGANPTEEAMLALMKDPVIMPQLMHSIKILIVFIGVIALALFLIIAFYYRMTNFVIIDKPAIPALLAMRESRTMMRHNCMKMLKLDLSMWWYYAAVILSLPLGIGDLILAVFGVRLPMNPIAASLLFQVLYLLANLLIILFLRPHVSVSYALAYDSLRPQEKPQEGAVLGNIFNM